MKSPSDFKEEPLTTIEEGQVEYLVKLIEDFYQKPEHSDLRNFVKMHLRSSSTPSGKPGIVHGVDRKVWTEVAKQASEAGWDAYLDDNTGHFICKRA